MLELKTDHQKGILAIAHERAEQIYLHGHTPEKDAEMNKNGELVQAALYLLSHDKNAFPCGWSDEVRKKFDKKPRKERIKVAAALLDAEYDRITLLETQLEEIDE